MSKCKSFEGTSTVLCDLDFRIVLRTSQPPREGGGGRGGGGVPSVLQNGPPLGTGGQSFGFLKPNFTLVLHWGDSM